MKFSSKLSITIFTTGCLVMGLLSFAIYRLNYSSTIKSQLKYSKFVADEISHDIDQFLAEKVKTALTLANTPLLKAYLKKSNSKYDRMSNENRKKFIQLQNKKWKTSGNLIDPFILEYTDNIVARHLKSQQKNIDGEYGEIFLTNKYGTLAASTSKLSTFAHGHKYWWLGCYNNGKGDVFFDDRGYDDSVDGYVLGIVVPIKNDSQTIIGILKCNLNIASSIKELLYSEEHEILGTFKLARSGGIVVFDAEHEPLSTHLHSSIINRLEAGDGGSFLLNDPEKDYLVGFSQVKLSKGGDGYSFGGTFESIDHKKGNTGESWFVISYREFEAALSSITRTIKSICWIGAITIAILVAVSNLFARRISAPLAALDKATKLISEGNFQVRINTQQNDEFGSLGRSFDTMSTRLQQTTTSLASLEKEIDRRKKIEKELREALSTVKTLSGLLPICSHCKKIRDDKGYWNQIESYIRDHSEAEFSHGICQECAKKYYPDLDLYDDDGEVTED